MAEKTSTQLQYWQLLDECRHLFAQKTADYGTAWRVLRLPSITDQIFIKANRIRSIQEKGVQQVADGIREEFIGILNYSLIALMQLELGTNAPMELSVDTVMACYDRQAKTTWELLQKKNHDYDEAWRLMRVSSITDIILMKLFRLKQIESNQGKTVVSEGVEANYRDILNYAAFALILTDQAAGGPSA